ncbi:SAE2-domain-containing protein [Hypoxylon cercidicola]|nr:SAE2-domain-containing protein [Hypoxylon cercidicola]
MEEGWFKAVGRPALFDALAGVCDRIDSDLHTSLKSYIDENARLSAELARAKSKASNVDRLEEENQSLRREVQNLKNASHANTSNVDQSKFDNDIRTPLAPRSVNQVSNSKRRAKSVNLDLDGLKLPELREEYLKLQGKFTKLHGKYSELEGAHTELNKRLRATTRGYNLWKDHANQVDEISKKRSQIIKKLKAKLTAAAAAASGPLDESFSSDSLVWPASRQLTVPNEPAGTRPNRISTESPLSWRPIDVGAPGHRSTRSTATPESARTHNESRISQRRDIAPNSENDVGAQDAGDVYTLPPLPQNRDVDTEVVCIKGEPSSDIPVVVSERCLRKRKYDNQTDAPRASTIKKEDNSVPLIAHERRHFSPHESIDFDVEGGTVHTPRKRNRPNPQSEDRFVLDSVEAPQLQARDTRSARPNRPSILDDKPRNSGDSHLSECDIESPEQQVNRSSALKPLDHNADNDRHRVSRPSTGGGARIGRLQNFLNTPSSGHGAIPVTPGAQSDNAPASRPFEFPAQQKRELPSNKGGAKTPSSISQSHDTSKTLNKDRTPGNINIRRKPNEKTMNRVAHDARPLRQRPKSELCITDFKINPAANEGYNYAFTDVVRNKDERNTLAGCIREDCCGPTFRLQARAMRGQTGPSDFHELLEKYLGDEAWKLSSMSKPEKEDLWVDAKMRELSNKHSRHRDRYHRAASPAGYWRIDFPNTQEELQDKEETARRLRLMVDERYREAMRPGGRWLFRDE